MKYFIAICDDEESQNIVLNKYIEEVINKYDYTGNVERFNHGTALLERVKNTEDDIPIVFLDMEMEGMNGLEVGKAIKNYNQDIIIIYITGFKDFALEAYGIRPLDYILKPINLSKIEKVLIEAIHEVDKIIKLKAIEAHYISVENNKTITKIDTNDIIYIEKKGNKLLIHSIDGIIELYSSLAKMYDLLDKSDFIKCHEGYIINIKKIRRFEKTWVTLSNHECIPVSRSNVKKVRQIIIESIRM